MTRPLAPATRARRLKAAGWVHIDGWLPPHAAYSAFLTQQAIAEHAAEADRIAATARQPGRPKGEGK